jgi:hypothetical protein
MQMLERARRGNYKMGRQSSMTCCGQYSTDSGVLPRSMTLSVGLQGRQQRKDAEQADHYALWLFAFADKGPCGRPIGLISKPFSSNLRGQLIGLQIALA